MPPHLAKPTPNHPLTPPQLWDVCSDQDAVDLIRATADPQLASKQLVDHALGRFSTDNLSCMVVRFDGAALRRQTGRPSLAPAQHAAAAAAAPATPHKASDAMGVDGDPPSRRAGGVSEAAAKVRAAVEAARSGDRAVAGQSATAVATAADAAADERDGSVEGTVDAEMGGGLKGDVAEEMVREEVQKEAGPEVSDHVSTEEVVQGTAGRTEAR